MQMLVPRFLEASIESLTREQEKFRQQMTQAFGVTPFGPLEDQVRRNMEMFERAFAMFTPFAKRQGGPRPTRRSRPAKAAAGAAKRSTSSNARWKRCRSGWSGLARRSEHGPQSRRAALVGIRDRRHGRSAEASPTSAPWM